MESVHAWEHVAHAWERHRARLFEGTRAVSEWLVDVVDAQPGRTILEVTAGPGETSFLAAERGARVICTDFAPAMVEAARRGAVARGLSNVDCRVMDAQALEIADGSVDGVISRYGLMLVPDAGAALREVRRVLRPTGRLAYAVWGPPERNLWIVMLGAALLQRGHDVGGDPFAPGAMFSLSTPARNAELLRVAGFSDLQIEALDVPLRFNGFDDWWTFQTEVAGPIALLLASLPEEEVRAIRSTAEASIAGFRTADGTIEFISTTVLARARPDRIQ